MDIYFKKIHPLAQFPKYAHATDAGADLFAVEPITIPPQKWDLIRTGLELCSMPLDIELQIRPRSGLALRHGITVLNSPGTIDSGYRGEIGVILINHGHQPYSILPGDKIAQLVAESIQKMEFKETTYGDSSDRGSRGFGSTGF